MPETPITVTVDTNLDDEDLEAIAAALAGVPHDIRPTTVTIRERPGFTDPNPILEGAVWGESHWGEAVFTGKAVPEVAVHGEWHLGMAELAGDVNHLETILNVISSGSFPPPGQRDNLTPGQRRQLRDGMIFEAHSRYGRQYFITRDQKGFIKSGKREDLEGLFKTRIRSPEEFVAEMNTT